MSFLLDTNVLSEARKPAGDANVKAWLASARGAELYLSVLVLGEIRQGIERLRGRDPAQAAVFEAWLTTLYQKEYRRLYSREGPDVALEAITWRLEVSAPPPEIRLDNEEGIADEPGKSQKGERKIYLPEEGGFLAVPVYDRYLLGPGASFEGPAVIEERESTVILGPEARSEIDEAHNLVVRWSG